MMCARRMIGYTGEKKKRLVLFLARDQHGGQGEICIPPLGPDGGAVTAQ